MNKESLVKSQLSAEVSHELAAKLVKNHQDATGADETNFFSIGKDVIQGILSQPGCVGLCFSEAITENGAKSLVCAGIDSKGKLIIETTTINGNGKLGSDEAKLAVIKSAGINPLPIHLFWGS